MVALVWFRRDLRVHDHPALRAALAEHEQVVPVFCLDDRLLHGRHASGPRTAFLLECLTDLDGQLAERGARLVIRHGPPERELPALAGETGASEIHLSRDPSPYEAIRGRRVRAALDQAGVSGHAHPGVSVVDDVRAIRTGQGRPYTVFTPFYRTWERVSRRPVLRPAATDRRCPRSPARPGAVAGQPRPRAGGAEPAPGGETRRADPAGGLPGRAGAGLRLRAATRSGADGSSRLSPYLRFGCLSPRARGGPAAGGRRRGRGADGFQRRQLCWRDFYPARAAPPPGQRPRRSSRSATAARWLEPRATTSPPGREGRTGFPLVDAGHAPAAPRGLDAQPRAADRRLVPDQGPRHRLAPGRALVHAAAARRRRGQQQRQLAVDRLGRRRSRSRASGASTTRLASRSASTPTARTCAATCPSWRGSPMSTWPSRGACPRRCRSRPAADRARLPGADRGPHGGPAGGA